MPRRGRGIRPSLRHCGVGTGVSGCRPRRNPGQLAQRVVVRLRAVVLAVGADADHVSGDVEFARVAVDRRCASSCRAAPSPCSWRGSRGSRSAATGSPSAPGCRASFPSLTSVPLSRPTAGASFDERVRGSAMRGILRLEVCPPRVGRQQPRPVRRLDPQHVGAEQLGEHAAEERAQLDAEREQRDPRELRPRALARSRAARDSRRRALRPCCAPRAPHGGPAARSHAFRRPAISGTARSA